METEVAFAIAFATGVLAYIAGKHRGKKLERQRWERQRWERQRWLEREQDEWPE
jgi:hypothetical protein